MNIHTIHDYKDAFKRQQEKHRDYLLKKADQGINRNVFEWLKSGCKYGVTLGCGIILGQAWQEWKTGQAVHINYVATCSLVLGTGLLGVAVGQTIGLIKGLYEGSCILSAKPGY